MLKILKKEGSTFERSNRNCDKIVDFCITLTTWVIIPMSMLHNEQRIHYHREI
jgi:hypothetical protein